MKTKPNKKVAIFLALLMLLTGFSAITSSAAEPDPLQPYKEILAEFNEEKGTDYIMVSDEENLAEFNLTKQEVIDFYTNIGPDAFHDYLEEIYMQNMNAPTITEITVTGGQRERAEEFIQLYLYQRANYLYLKSKVVQVNGKVYYNSVVEVGEKHLRDEYPIYALQGDPSYEVSDDSTAITVTYKYNKLIGEGISDSTLYSIAITYYAQEWKDYE